MKAKLLCGFIVLLFAVHLNAQSGQMNKKQLQDMYVSFLKEEGYQPRVDDDGDIVFKAEGGNFYIDVDEKDLQSFRIVFPNFWEIESPEEKERVFVVSNYINRTTKVAKVFINPREDNVSMDANVFLEKPEGFKPLFGRMINLLLSEWREFREEMDD